MKIGILTYHRSHNYGALLQAMALRHTLSALGHDVYFVDYWPEYHADMYRPVSRRRLRVGSIPGRVKYLLGVIAGIRKTRRRIECFNRFIEANIAPYCRPADDEFDVVVYGSDQIWRHQDGLGGKINPVYFGETINAGCHLAYAASMGQINLDSKEKDEIRARLGKFDGVAVRESDLQRALTDMGVPDVEQVLDPTLLLDEKDWREIITIAPAKEKYVLFYDLMPDSFDIDRIRRFASEKGLPLKVLKGRVESPVSKPDVLDTEDPSGMVNLIANAEYVFTSSYHGLVFSLIFGKEVVSAFHHNKGRAESLLTAIGLRSRLLDSKDATYPVTPVNYAEVRESMKRNRASSLLYLKRHLELRNI